MASNDTNCRIIVLAKAPIPGEVKTRLLSSMEAQMAAALHKKLVLLSLRTAVEARVGPVELWCWPSTQHPFFLQCAETFPVTLYEQTGEDLGKRMALALNKALTRAPLALLIGTDSPSLHAEDLKEAKDFLEKGVPAVITPAEDGGYVLIGLRQYDPVLFEGIPWGTESVLKETRARLHQLGWDWKELPMRWDVDRPEDVERLKIEGYLDLMEIQTR